MISPSGSKWIPHFNVVKWSIRKVGTTNLATEMGTFEEVVPVSSYSNYALIIVGLVAMIGAFIALRKT